MKNNRDEITGAFIVDPNPFPYKYPNILFSFIRPAYIAYEDET
jgi:hypothetical protein